MISGEDGSLTKIDTAKLDKLISVVSKGGMKARVGYFEDSGTHPRSGLTAGDIARIQHEGSKYIPQRPWVTDGANEAKLPTERAMKLAYQKVQKGEITLKRAIEMAAGVQKYRITQVLDQAKSFYSNKPNAPSTVSKKGFDSPLLEIGWIRDKIDIKIEGDKR